MNTALLRRARRHHDGTRLWVVPGQINAAMLIPAHRSHPGWGTQFVWPGQDRDGDDVKMSVDLARHRFIARRAARDLIDAAGREVDEQSRNTDRAVS